MHKNYSQALQMQIPQENRYTGQEFINYTQNNLKEFLKNNFEIPSNNLEDINNYIEEDHDLEKIICDLPNIISKEFPKCPIILDFMDYTLPNEVILQITIKTPYDGETSSTKKDIILEEIFNYKNPKKYYFITMEF